MYKRREIIDTNFSRSDFSRSELYDFDEFDELDDHAVGGVA